MKTLKFFSLALLGAAITLSSCEQEPMSELDGSVNFSASLSEYQTKAEPTPFTEGNKALIYAYTFSEPADFSTFTNAQFPAIATADASGNIVVTPSITLPKGKYDFYCVSQNTNSIEKTDIEIANGVSKVLSNNIDYLWAKDLAQDVNSNTNVDFTLSHLCSQITINLIPNATQGVADLNVKDMQIKLPTPTAEEGKLTLSTGAISVSAAKASTFSSITKNGANNEFSYIVLPCSDAALDMELTADFSIRGTSYTDRLFATTSSIANGFEAGQHYTITLTVGAREITFNSVTVTPWVNQPLEGVDIFEK